MNPVGTAGDLPAVRLYQNRAVIGLMSWNDRQPA